MESQFHKVGFLATRGDRILLCRKKYGTTLLILPGGCFEPGETAAMCLARELREELGDVTPHETEFLGAYRDRAAGHDTKTVQIELYRGQLSGTPEPQSEIAELVWFGPEDDRAELSPITANQILPDLIRRGILRWSEPAK